MTSRTLSIERIKEETLPALFADPNSVGQYGTSEEGVSAMNELSSLMEAGAVQKLADSIQVIVTRLADADPQKIAQKPSLIDRILGRSIEREVRYRVARQTLETLIAATETYAVEVKHTVKSIDALLAQHADEIADLGVLLQAGREFLAENPSAGIYDKPEMEFDRPRDRFSRKLTNMATLIASHEMSVLQMKLARAHAVDMLDRFAETVSVLVPVWRQNALALITTKNMSPDLIASATKVHQELIKSLASSLQPTQR